MKFRYYEVSTEDESTGTGSRIVFFSTLRSARAYVYKAAEMEREADSEDGIPESGMSTAVIQEIELRGTPKAIAAAALVAAGSGDEAEWDADWRGERGDIHRLRRWNVTSRGGLIQVADSL